MNAREQLRRLLRIQELALEIQAAKSVVEGAPARIDVIEGQFRERNAEYVALKTRYEEIEKDQRERNGELEMLAQSLKKYMDGLMQVKNQREYAAVLKEIDTVKAQISAHEDVLLKHMDESEKLKTDLDARSAHIEEERALVEGERAQVEADAAAAQDRIRSAQAERSRIEAELLPDLVDSLRRIEDARQGVFLARAERELCQACFVRVRPQVYQEIRQCARIHWCSNCRRFLYYEPALRAEAAEAPAEVPSPAVEASNGGAI